MQSEIRVLAQKAREASRLLARASQNRKNDALLKMASGLEAGIDSLLSENALDVQDAVKRGTAKPMIDRLTLTPSRVKEMAKTLREVASLPDPVGEITRMWMRPNGLRVGRMRIPLGVIAIVYEARPNVTSDAASLCLKSGNAVILKGGSEALRSNLAIAAILRSAAADAGLPEDSITVISSKEREAVKWMLSLDDLIDLVIPRGGEGLIRFVAENSKIPVIKHYKGVCHVFVDSSADWDMAEKIIINGKLQRPSVCNALETLLVHSSIAPSFIPHILKKLSDSKVEIRGCPETQRLFPGAKPATEDDWYAEYLDLILSVRIVGSLDEAVHHIEKYGSMHTETIVTKDYLSAQRFLSEVGSSVVLVNASTRFSDGGELGLGAEIGISTTRLHAFGPMGLEELTTTKFIVYGDGQVRG